MWIKNNCSKPSYFSNDRRTGFTAARQFGDDGVRAGATPVRQRVSTRLLPFRNRLGYPKFRVCQAIGVCIRSHISI